MEFKETLLTSAHTPDMCDLDTYVDTLVEKYGGSNEKLIRSVAEDLRKPMEEENERCRGMMLGRVVCYLVRSEANNVLARVHQLLHAIPRLATQMGYGSMRKSARACRVSPEWIKRGRDEACEVIGIPIPTEGQKSQEARDKYRENAKKNHWRNQTFTASKLNRHDNTCKHQTRMEMAA
jgi:hypothetical protein